MNIDYSARIPNNVDLAGNRTLQRALEHWQPGYLDWWSDMGPDGAQDYDVYLRTATSVDPKGWAHFDHVKMPDYRWGIFLTPPEAGRKVNFGAHKGEPAWQDVPGEYRSNLRFGPGETQETRIFGRLSAWQNWIFVRPNATGDAGALKLFGTGRKPRFDRHRV